MAQRGILVRFFLFVVVIVVVVLVGNAVYAEDDSGLEDDCCHDDYTDDLDPGLGLLAEEQVIVTVRRTALSLHCDVASEPQFGNLTFMWKVAGKKIQSRSPKGRRYSYPNGTLHIRKVVHRTKKGVRVSDEGMYECFVSNSVGTAIVQRIQVVVASLGKNFTVQPMGGTIKMGDNFFLPCQISASPPDLMVVWQKDAVLLKIDDHPRYVQTNEGLLILNAEEGDSGTYQCQITNKNFFTFVHDNNPSPLQWRNSQPATLIVSPSGETPDEPFLLVPSNITDVMVGDSIDLQCVPTTYKLGGVVWTRTDPSDMDKEVPVKTSSDFTVLPSGSLRVHKARRHLAGTYTCTHSEGFLASTSLQVLEKPVIQDSSPSRVYPLASMVRLDCLVAGQPTPTVRWLKNGREVSTILFRVEFLQEALVIYQGKTEDSGYYQCLVENKAGWAMGLTRVAVRVEPDAPPPPFNVTGEAISSSRIVVQWKIDQPSRNLLSFTIHRRMAEEEGGEEAEIVDRMHRQAVLYGLFPDTLYAITVRAYSKGGASPSSTPTFIKTDLTEFPSPSLTYISNSTISLNWSDFHLRHRRKDDITSYQVFYGLSNEKHEDKVVLDATQDTLLLTNLEENREYRVRMKATFKGDDSSVQDKNWPWGYIRTGNASLPTLHKHLTAPFNLRAGPLQANTISLSWTYSSESLKASLPVTHYTVRCQMLESMALGHSCQEFTSQSIILKTSHRNMATLDSLKAYTVYNISVSAHSDNLQGPYSRPIIVQTKEDVPSRPENLEARVLSVDEVHLQWQPPTTPNGLIQGHYILYVSQQSPSSNSLVNVTWVQLYQKGNTTRITVRNLTQKVYIFRVVACTNAGRGAPSSLVFVNMGDNMSKGGLSDQHLGILGGSAIGLTSIIITIIVIVCKQRQLQKQLENRYKVEQERQLCPRPVDSTSPTSLTSQLTPSIARSEELEQLLTQQPHTGCLPPPPPTYPGTYPHPPSNASVDSDSRDSGCSSSTPQAEDETVSNQSVSLENEDEEGVSVVWNISSPLSPKDKAPNKVKQSEEEKEKDDAKITCSTDNSVGNKETVC